MMIAAINWFLDATLGLSLLLALILLLRRPLGIAPGARTVYWLWLTVPVQLVLSVPWVQHASPMRIALPSIIARPEADGILGAPLVPGLVYGLSLLWLAGACLLVARLTMQAINAARMITASAPWPPREDWPHQHQAIRQIRLSHQVRSPVVAGLLRARILVPADIEQRLDGASLDLVLRHESCHARRRDNLANLLAGLILALFWFNPLIWVAYRAFRADQELSCDAHAVGDADKAHRARYGRAMLELVSPVGPSPLATGWHLQHSTKRRITMLNRHHHSRLRTLSGAGVVCSFIAILVAFGPATGAAQPADEALVDEMPRPIVRINPAYPAEAIRQGLEGFVTMEFTITEGAAVEDIVVLDAHPEGVFDAAAVSALSKWRFVPEKTDATVLPRRAAQTIEFRLDRDPAE